MISPTSLSRKLEQLASTIETAKNPSRDKVQSVLSKMIMAVESDGFAVPVGQVINHLVEWQSAKYTIDILYRNFADRIKGPWRDSIVEHWYKHAEEERENAYNLSMKIMSLGADPIHTAISLPPAPADLTSFCAILMDLETKAIEKGKQAVEYAGENVSLRVFAEDIILVDSQHLDDLSRMCVDYKL